MPSVAVAALDLVDQRLGAAFAELVSLVDRRDAEVAGVGAAAAGLDEHVRLVDHRQRVVARGRAGPTPAAASARKPANVPCARCGTTPCRRGARSGWRPRRADRANRAPQAGATPSSGSPTNMPSTCGARAIDSAGAVDACGPKQNIGAPIALLEPRHRVDVGVERRRRGRERRSASARSLRRRAGR